MVGYAGSVRLDAQLARLRVAFSRSALGRAVAALVEGAAGCGKIHGLDTLAAHAAQADALVLTAQASSAETGPLAVLGHLTDPPQMPSDAAGRLWRSLVPYDSGVARRFRAELHDLARQRPVLFRIDDLHHADETTLRHLLSLIIRPAQARVFLLRAQLPGEELLDAGLTAALLRAADRLHIRLDRSTMQEAAGRRPADWYQLTGGNPLLVRALVEDWHQVGQPSGPVPGDLFVQVSLTCIQRAGPAASRVARGIAELLYDEGAPAVDIARRLLRVPPARLPWTVPVLRAAAQALADDEQLGLSCLKRARTDSEDGERNGITIAMARARARLGPVAAEHFLDLPLHAVRTGRLPTVHGAPLVRLLSEREHAAEVCATTGAGLEADRLPGHGLDGDAVRQLLALTPLIDATFGILTEATRVPAHSGYPSEAAARCRNLATDVRHHGAPGWRAVLIAFHMEIALYRGDLAGAAASATEALDTVRSRVEGAFAGGALATRVFARTASGDFRPAAGDLAIAVPKTVSHSVHDLRLARARGCFHLATCRPTDALEEFLAIGDTTRSRQADTSRSAPWNSTSPACTESCASAAAGNSPPSCDRGRAWSPEPPAPPRASCPVHPIRRAEGHNPRHGTARHIRKPVVPQVPSASGRRDRPRVSASCRRIRQHLPLPGATPPRDHRRPCRAVPGTPEPAPRAVPRHRAGPRPRSPRRPRPAGRRPARGPVRAQHGRQRRLRAGPAPRTRAVHRAAGPVRLRPPCPFTGHRPRRLSPR
ncbi:hypothetical protein SVIO_025940 [Streptomyces violaceusniger]|uniref:Orc1-like AAA ATPase domain-containing protein n=1 Tax=Streptomyces violaceusniger TaxID=68280 RepID=A0A4D4KRM4_STRVO|nr:hypothetical protein SVIO_025940 [Streptomyces violaceusniger]